MSDTILNYYDKLIDFMSSKDGRISVPKSYHAQVSKIKKLVNNDKTAIISTILDFMIQAACTDIKFQTNNSNLTKNFELWKKSLNSEISRDIPRGLRSLSEQYFRERWTSSFIVLNIVWGDFNGYEMPVKMYFSDGGSIYATNDKGALNTAHYYLGNPKGEANKELLDTVQKQYLIRKPYNAWYDLYPTPYLVKKGAIYHAIFKENIIDEELKALAQLAPAMTAIKMGSVEAMRQKQNPSEEDMKLMHKKFQELSEDDYYNIKKKIAVLPFDVDIQNLLPELTKVFDPKITETADKNLLMAMGLIEFKGFSTNREESILNPKPLVSEIEDAVLDWVDLLNDVCYLIQQRNSSSRKKYSTQEVRIVPGIIKTLMTDGMRVLLRAVYDRGLISRESMVENITPLDFQIEIQKKENEENSKIKDIMFPPPIINTLDQNDNRDMDPTQNDTPQQKKSEPDITA